MSEILQIWRPMPRCYIFPEFNYFVLRRVQFVIVAPMVWGMPALYEVHTSTGRRTSNVCAESGFRVLSEAVPDDINIE